MRKEITTICILALCLLAAISGCNNVEERKAEAVELTEAEYNTEASIEEVSKLKTVEASSVTKAKNVSDFKDAIKASEEKAASIIASGNADIESFVSPEDAGNASAEKNSSINTADTAKDKQNETAIQKATTEDGVPESTTESVSTPAKSGDIVTEKAETKSDKNVNTKPDSVSDTNQGAAKTSSISNTSNTSNTNENIDINQGNKSETNTDSKNDVSSETKTKEDTESKEDTKSETGTETKQEVKPEAKTETTEVTTPVVEIYAGISREDAIIKASSIDGPVSQGSSNVLSATKGSTSAGEQAWVLKTSPAQLDNEVEKTSATYYVSASFCNIEYENLGAE